MSLPFKNTILCYLYEHLAKIYLFYWGAYLVGKYSKWRNGIVANVAAIMELHI